MDHRLERVVAIPERRVMVHHHPKASHHRPTNRLPAVVKQTWPTTSLGTQLAEQIRDASNLTADSKAKLTREIIDHEASHGQCTQTFLKKVRKQVRP